MDTTGKPNDPVKSSTINDIVHLKLSKRYPYIHTELSYLHRWNTTMFSTVHYGSPRLMMLIPDKIWNPHPQLKLMARMNTLFKPYWTPEFTDENYSI
jgi:hypothetical protein